VAYPDLRPGGRGERVTENLRARIIGLGIWVMNETQRLMRDAASLADLIEVNRSIIRGLATAAEGAR